MNRHAEHDIRHKTKVLEDVKQSGNVSHTCRRYGISRDTFYHGKKQYETQGHKAGRRIKRFQYTAIDDNTRILALKVYR